MTNTNQLSTHIQDVQDSATILHGVISAIEVLDDVGTCPNGVASLIRVAGNLSRDVQNKLDCTILPEVLSND